MKAQAYRADLDGVRAVAIFSVIAYHVLPSAFPSGFVGVDVFFVLSGYLISTLIYKGLQAESFSFVEFYSRRARRIFPALVLVMACSLLVGWFTLLPNEFEQLGKSVTAGAGFAQNFNLWREAGYFDVSSDLKPLMHLWSLAIEEQFYLVFPPLIWLLWKSRLNIGATIAMIILISLTADIYVSSSDPTQAFFLPQFRMWQIMFGALLAWLEFKDMASWRGFVSSSLLSFAGLGLICVAIFSPRSGMDYPSWAALIPTLGTVFLIAAGERAWVNRNLLSQPKAVWLGIISYPLYLWHWPLLSFAHIAESATPTLGFRVGVVFLSVVFAYLTNRYIESPIRYGLRWRRSKTLIVTAMLALVGACGFFTFMEGGFPSRIPLHTKAHRFAEHLEKVRQKMEADKQRCAKLFPHWMDDYDNACFFQTEAPPSILLIGDSHAGHLYLGLRRVIPASENLAVFSASCAAPFFDVSTGTHDLRFYKSRKKSWRLMNSAIEYAIKNDRVKTVILVHHPQCSQNDAIDIENPADRDTRNVLKTGMERTVSRLVRHGKSVIVVLDNPLLSFDPAECAWRPFRFPFFKSRHCFLSKEEINGDDADRDYRDIAHEIVEEFPQVKIFDLASWLCKKEHCSIVRKHLVLYSDRSHLSAFGSEYVAKALYGLTRQGKD